jgi:hypothetical protein
MCEFFATGMLPLFGGFILEQLPLLKGFNLETFPLSEEHNQESLPVSQGAFQNILLLERKVKQLNLYLLYSGEGTKTCYI